MADKYAAKETSGLKFTVKAGANLINLKLDGPWANPPKEEEGKAGTDADAKGKEDATEPSPTEPSATGAKEGATSAGGLNEQGAENQK